MRISRESVVPALVCLAFVIALGAASAQPPAFKRTILQRGDLAAPGHEGVMAIAEFPPGASAGRHTHPGEEISYVLEGSLEVQVAGQAPKTVKAGDAFWIPAGTVHDAKNTGAGSAKIVATYVVEKGKPMATPARLPRATGGQTPAAAAITVARSGPDATSRSNGPVMEWTSDTPSSSMRAFATSSRRPRSHFTRTNAAFMRPPAGGCTTAPGSPVTACQGQARRAPCQSAVTSSHRASPAQAPYGAYQRRIARSDGTRLLRRSRASLARVQESRAR